jgi:hypothetical protein
VTSRGLGDSEFFWEQLRDGDSAKVQRSLERDGFAVIRGILEAQEIDRLRAIVRDHLLCDGVRLGLGKSQPNAAIMVPQLGSLFANERIIRLFKSILGDDQVVFTGHCDIHMNMLSGWHKDSGEGVGGYFRGDYFTARECRVYKVAIYLQDSDSRTGFVVRRGSHRSSALMGGEELRVDTRVGDIVVFDVRISHAGQLPDLLEKALKACNLVLARGDRTKHDSRLIGACKESYWRLLRRPERMSIFYTLGCANEYTFDFAFANMVRQIKQSGRGETHLPLELTARLRALGVVPYDPSIHAPSRS